MPPSRIAIFPGSFDPLTNGHVDLIRRAARLFDRLVVAVLVNPDKKSLFTAAERVAMIAEVCIVLPESDRVTAGSFEGLLVRYAAGQGACAVVRGLRSGADVDYERPMAAMNAYMAPSLDTVFLAASDRYAHVSSRLVKEVASYGVPVEELVPPLVASRLAAHFAAVRGGR
ncbi:MAG: pantetheine-phosphate adenylyltransferase [Vicinamibacterales bacterium]